MRLLSPFSRFRSVFDALWVGSFIMVLSFMLWHARGASRADAVTPLDLRAGTQVQGLYRHGVRLGTVSLATKRDGKGWRMERRIELQGRRAAQFRLRLRSDLSLFHVALDADLAGLGDLAGVPADLLRVLGQDKTSLALHGECAVETGVCHLRGRLGGRQVDLPVAAGRGPVVAGAIYPLLARGRLGRKVEISLFDPLSLRQHVVSYRVETKEQLRLSSGIYPALRVSCDLGGVSTRVWLDPAGLVLQEELPLGITLQHESWRRDE